MTATQKEELNKYINHIKFLNEEGEVLNETEYKILQYSKKIHSLKKSLKYLDDINIRFMIFELKHKLAIIIIEYYNLENKNLVERLEEKRLKNIQNKKSA
ncbi:MAG: hypothetical protein BHK79_10380 [Halanaerobium sp. MDAL1]|nr:MAG: hypothetical protein BHK79_10380 [Halanaerobium sp. MDAL1]